jgi:hypothetical protein
MPKCETSKIEEATTKVTPAVKTEAAEVAVNGRPETTCRIPCEDKAAGGSVWLCLRCGSQACGGNVKDHSWAHYSQPRWDTELKLQ